MVEAVDSALEGRARSLANLRPQPWKPGQSGNPAGKQPKAITALLKRLDDKAEAEALVASYLELCHSKKESIRLQALTDLLDRLGFGKDEEGKASATATVVNIIRNGASLNMTPPSADGS